MYITSFRLSRTFFKSFLTSGPLCISSNFLSLPHSGSFVKNFFQKFLNFRFPLICGNFLSLPHRAVAVKCFFLFTLWRSAYRADSFVRIPDHPSFVNAFLQSFFLFLISTIHSPYPSTTFVHLCKQMSGDVCPHPRSFYYNVFSMWISAPAQHQRLR